MPYHTCSADKIVNSTLLPMLRDAGGLHVNVHQTKAPGDAEQLLSTLDLESVDMVVYVGGDGTVFEGLQVCAQGCQPRAC